MKKMLDPPWYRNLHVRYWALVNGMVMVEGISIHMVYFLSRTRVRPITYASPANMNVTNGCYISNRRWNVISQIRRYSRSNPRKLFKIDLHCCPRECVVKPNSLWQHTMQCIVAPVVVGIPLEIM